MKFKLVARKNPQDLKADPKHYAQPVYNGTVDVDFIAKQIAGRSSLTAGDIKNVLSNFLDEVPTYMLLGYSVKLNDFGTFRISYSSEGILDPAKFKTTLMNGVKVIYTPDVDLKKRIEDSIAYEHDKTIGGGNSEPEEPGGGMDRPDEI